jgi:hypothetical protein
MKKSRIWPSLICITLQCWNILFFSYPRKIPPHVRK